MGGRSSSFRSKSVGGSLGYKQTIKEAIKLIKNSKTKKDVFETVPSLKYNGHNVVGFKIGNNVDKEYRGRTVIYTAYQENGKNGIAVQSSNGSKPTHLFDDGQSAPEFYNVYRKVYGKDSVVQAYRRDKNGKGYVGKKINGKWDEDSFKRAKEYDRKK